MYAFVGLSIFILLVGGVARRPARGGGVVRDA